MRHSLMSLCLALLALAELTTHGVAAFTDAPKPLSIPTTETWDGDDGSWSSFAIEIGTPPQSVRVFPSTSTNAFWAVFPRGCPPEDTPKDCPSQRGELFNPNKSRTWDSLGSWKLGLYAEEPLGYSALATFGYDDVTLGYPQGGLPKISHQVVQLIATPEFYLGSFGLDASAINLSSVNDYHPSPLTSLFDAGAIPSKSWGYTAGAPYRHSGGVFGSLVLGGYDKDRFRPNSLSIPFASDESRRFVVAIQSIVSDKSVGNAAKEVALQQSGMFAYIDSLVSEIWLPLEACKEFEKAFNLTWNPLTELYPLSDEQHDTLMALNPTVTFWISADLQDKNIVAIELPYASFDLTVRPPGPGVGFEVSSATKYFPLRRANSSNQYTLGRTFLQEAYLIADYHRQMFSVSQAVFPANPNVQRLVAIDPGVTKVNGGDGPVRYRKAVPDVSSAGLGTGAVVGITLSVVFAILLVALVAFLLYRRRRSRRRSEPDSADPVKGSSLTDASEAGEQRSVEDTTDEEESGCNELEAKDNPTELDGGFGALEMSEGHQQRPELQGRFTENFTEDDFPVDHKEPIVDQYETDGSDLVSPIVGVFSPIGDVVSPIKGQFNSVAELESPIAELDGTPVDKKPSSNE